MTKFTGLTGAAIMALALGAAGAAHAASDLNCDSKGTVKTLMDAIFGPPLARFTAAQLAAVKMEGGLTDFRTISADDAKHVCAAVLAVVVTYAGHSVPPPAPSEHDVAELREAIDAITEETKLSEAERAAVHRHMVLVGGNIQLSGGIWADTAMHFFMGSFPDPGAVVSFRGGMELQFAAKQTKAYKALAEKDSGYRASLSALANDQWVVAQIGAKASQYNGQITYAVEDTGHRGTSVFLLDHSN